MVEINLGISIGLKSEDYKVDDFVRCVSLLLHVIISGIKLSLTF